jgi:transcriptional regulator with XRE-family HTH domain
MTKERKSTEEAKLLGAWLQKTRVQLGFTIENVQEITQINVGQISRFETGEFVFVSDNLQKLIDFLQNRKVPEERQPHLVNRFADLLERSQRHQAAALALVSALEQLQ